MIVYMANLIWKISINVDEAITPTDNVACQPSQLTYKGTLQCHRSILVLQIDDLPRI